MIYVYCCGWCNKTWNIIRQQQQKQKQNYKHKKQKKNHKICVRITSKKSHKTIKYKCYKYGVIYGNYCLYI